MLTYPWKCTVLHCNHLGNTWKPLVLMTRHFDYSPSASEGDNQSVRSSAPVVSRCFPGGYNVKLYISRARLAWWLLAFLHSVTNDHVLRAGISVTWNVLCHHLEVVSSNPDWVKLWVRSTYFCPKSYLNPSKCNLFWCERKNRYETLLWMQINYLWKLMF